MNLPLHQIHCIRSSYGILLLPAMFGYWLAYFPKKGLRLTNQFHNCTTTRIR